MSTVLATIAAVAALSAAGVVPVVGTVGLRWFAVPLTPLAGAVLAAVAANASLSFGGPLLTWFVVLAALSAVSVFSVWVLHPDRGPWGRERPAPMPGRRRHRMVGIVGFLGVVAACAWSLRGLRTPTVGFDARALWVMRPGWFLQSHAQLLIDMRTPGLVLTQSSYPPLVSAVVAVAWRVTGIHTARLGVTTMAVVNACALTAAALALVECGRGAAARLATGGGADPVRGAHRAGAGAGMVRPPWGPMVAGVVAAVLLVPVAAGITEPFLTNGYADPIWSLAAVGAVAYGLQVRSDRSTRAAAAVLILVAGLSKNEGLLTAVALVVLVAARSIGPDGIAGGWSGWRRGWRDDRPATVRRWAVPLGVAAAELAVLAWWPLLMHGIGARGASTSFTTSTDTASRTSAVVHGMSPYLHVLVLAVPLAVVGGLGLRAVRRRAGVGNDLWAWLALAVGLVAVGGALVTGSGAILPWIRSTVHRITEYPVLQGWWIIAVWAVVAAAAVGGRTTVTDDGDRGLGDGVDVPVTGVVGGGPADDRGGVPAVAPVGAGS